MTKVLTFFKFRKKTLLSLILSLMFIWSLTGVTWNSDLVHTGGKVMLVKIVKSLFSPEISRDVLMLAIKSAWITLVYAICGISIAVIIAFVFGTLASGVLFRKKSKSYISITFRLLLGLMRSIHELVWAWLFVASIGLTPFSAIFALAIPYGGILGRIYADKFRDVDNKPIESLKSSGSNALQTLFYGYLPLSMIDIMSYTMYRFECAIRSSTIMSFVGLGGLGYQIQLSLDDLNYNRVWSFMFFLVILVVLIDLWSSKIRKELEQ